MNAGSTPSGRPEYPPLLTPGRHILSIEELRALCVTRFAGSATRDRIMTSLEAIIERLTEVSIEGELWIDGSFTTEKLDPADSDIVLRLFDEFVERTTDEQFETIEWLNSNLKSTHLCDSYLFVEYPEGHLNHSEGLKLRDYWMKQWGFSRGDQPKGIAVVVLGAGR